MKFKFSFLVIFLMSTLQTTAQNTRWGLFIGGGTTWYYGDMNDRLLAHRKLFSYHLTGGLIYKASPRIYINGAFAIATVKGADSLAIQEFNLKRNLHYRNDIWQATLKMEYRLLGYRNGNTRRVTPYVFGGVGYFHFNPIAELNGNDIELQPLGTEGQYIEGGGNPEPYSLYGFNFPFGIGVEFRLTRSLAARVEVTNHFTLTDYFDDLSSDYADSSLLAATPNGLLAVEMASNLATGYPREGFGRGDPKDNDSYAFLGVTLLWSPDFLGKGGGSGGYGKGAHRGGRKKKKANCPAFD